MGLGSLASVHMCLPTSVHHIQLLLCAQLPAYNQNEEAMHTHVEPLENNIRQYYVLKFLLCVHILKYY